MGQQVGVVVSLDILDGLKQGRIVSYARSACLNRAYSMQGRFERDSLLVVKPGVRLPFRFPRRKGIIRFAYDHEPPAYDVEFYWCGESLGTHYFTEEELDHLILVDSN
jgi:hypothetical protein